MASESLGLRERKKLKTRVTLRKVAYELFREQGFDQTTVAQIAAAAEVSQATFFRYFPTKEALVLEDDYDAVMFEGITSVDAARSLPAQILRTAADEFTKLDDEALQTEIERSRLLRSSGSLRAASYESMHSTLAVVADLVVKAADGPVDPRAVRVALAATVGAINALAQDDPEALRPASLRALADLFEAGLPISASADAGRWTERRGAAGDADAARR